MGKPTGFLEYKRENVRYRDPLERIRDWKEISSLPSENTLAKQAARCMDCGVPFCQNGSLIGGMTTGCPIFNLIPEWNELVYQGKWKEAYERLSKTNPFPEFTGRACPAPCEAGCVASLYESSVSIKSIEWAIIEKAFEEGWVKPQIPKQRTGIKIAVVGSGPAGLACAYELNNYGHSVTVFERSDRVGGLLTYGIPKMKIEQHVVDRRIRLMEESGISFLTNVEVGKDYSIERLKEEFDAVILCTGATKPRDMDVKGRNLKGIHFAMEYLHSNTKSLLDSDLKNGQYISAEGKDVVVIGGGDTAVDCIATALRQNCKSVVQLDIYPKRPAERAPDNPWPQYPLIYKLDYGQEEAKAKFGDDPRLFATSALEFIGDDGGRLVAVKTVGIKTTFNEKGEKIREPIPNTEKVLSAQLVLIAIGFEGPERELFDQLNIDVGGLRKSRSYQTDLENVFVAGDARRGQSLIVWAIQEGKEAAKRCHRYVTSKVNLSF
ncbi:glutamate synthase subunit beta [Ureibacillus sp. FSL K6-8385]|uniref:Glutamate synthase subunit beta n=1 Tax=Ureibacillus terrenus TaxID=118246 RepID=A0A540V536_9BACL|nr:glutamate synthase subunit beta [Ureibacillus terrenus]MED3662631.1 glutamate synthase subunit beta [Ureibacillus terrenus]TQE91852.1 glutamate synthase subunit beta [Ureibacillus terrenus]